jgi:hypothetical protein
MFGRDNWCPSVAIRATLHVILSPRKLAGLFTTSTSENKKNKGQKQNKNKLGKHKGSGPSETVLYCTVVLIYPDKRAIRSLSLLASALEPRPTVARVGYDEKQLQVLLHLVGIRNSR